MYIVSTAIYDAWAAYSDEAYGRYSEIVPTGPLTEAAIAEAVSYAAYAALKTMFAQTENQQRFDDFMTGLGLTPFSTILVIVLLYIVLGFFIETLSLMVVTIPIIVPLVVELGYDPIWFGILMIVLIEMALITPPVGLNLYVVQGARKSGTLSEVMIGAAPYVFMMLLMVAALIAVPDIALFLPGLLE